MRLLSPNFSTTMRGGGCNVTLAREDLSTASAKALLLRIDTNAPADNTSSSGMLGKNPSEQLASPKENLQPRLRRRRSASKMMGENVAAGMAVKADSSSNGYRELG